VQGRVPGPALELALRSIALLDELSRELPGDVEYVRAGGLILAEDATEHRLLREFARRQSAHVPVEFLEADAVRRLEPRLNPARVLGGTFCALDGYVNPMALTLALARGAVRRGARILSHTEVTGIEKLPGRVAGVRTTGPTLWAPVVVNAAGVWSPDLARLAGLDVAVIPRKGQLLVSEPLPPLVGSVISHAGHVPFREHGIDAPAEVEGELSKKRYLKQTRGGGFAGRVYVGSTSEFVGFDRASTWDGVGQLCRYAVDTVPALSQTRLVRAWAGLRPRSGDGRFIIGPTPSLGGFWLATGHDSIGVLYSIVTGTLLAQWIVSGARPDLLASFDPGRRVPIGSAA
jgi:sarcosine oxidase subunit beta